MYGNMYHRVTNKYPESNNNSTKRKIKKPFIVKKQYKSFFLVIIIYFLHLETNSALKLTIKQTNLFL